jgi:oligopeptide/dipeptide ABC transporter ATP-binding protein
MIILFFIGKFAYNPLVKDYQITKREKSLSLLFSSLMTIGIILAIRYTFGYLGIFVPFFRIFGSGVSYSLEQIEFVFFAVLSTIFFPIFKFFLKKFTKSRYVDNVDDQNLNHKKFFKRSLLIIGGSWVVALVFLSIDLLDIPIGHLIPPDPLSPTYDVFLLGFEWAFFLIVIDISLTIVVNKIIPTEKRLSKEVLNKSILSGGTISFLIWSVQLIIVELYLSRVFGVQLYQQDIRVLIIVVTTIYISSFLILLKYKFAPEASEKSMKEVELALQLEKRKSIPDRETAEVETILEVQDLTTYFYTEEGVVHAVEGVSFKIHRGMVLGLVGETGCGKSVTALSILQLIRPPGKIVKGKVKFGDINLLEISEIEILPYRGKDITMIFQDPLNSLNPVFKVGNQISEVFLLHKRNELLVEASKNQDKSIYSIAREWSQELLQDLNIPAPQQIFDRYPHELSGGMRQRIQIAMALVCSPKLLIADEPTTALDVTVQNQILKLMKDLKKKYNTSILFITHDLGIISKMCDHVAVMYSGSIVEYGKITTLFTNPLHPYTRGLVSSVPVVGKKREILEIIPGMVPNLIYPPSGCRFHPRCEYCFEPCDSNIPKNIEIESDYFIACHLYDPQYKDLAEISIKKIEN